MNAPYDAPAQDAAQVDPRFAPPPQKEDPAAAIGLAFGIIGNMMESKAANAMVALTKVFLFNFFLFAPIAALLYIVFFMNA